MDRCFEVVGSPATPYEGSCCELGSHAAVAPPQSQPTVADAGDVSEGIAVYSAAVRMKKYFSDEGIEAPQKALVGCGGGSSRAPGGRDDPAPALRRAEHPAPADSSPREGAQGAPCSPQGAGGILLPAGGGGQI
eukprot:gene11426-biopygen1832